MLLALFIFSLIFSVYEESSRALLALLQLTRKVAKKAQDVDFLPIQRDGFVISGGPPSYGPA